MAGSVEGSDARAPRPALLWAVALAGCAAAAGVVGLALASDHVEEPGLQAALVDWLVLSYVFAGLVAWRLRPASRFGPLLVVAGFAMPLAILGWANAPVWFTLGQTLDLLPLVVFLHVFLAFPTGRLDAGFARWLVVATYVVGVGGVLVRGLLGEFGPRYLLAVVDAPETAAAVRSVQLIAVGAACLAGIAVLALRRRTGGRPRRRSVRLLVDSFVLGLVMIALLLVAGDFDWPAFETIRRATYVLLGIAPVAFLIGLLDVRLARSSVGDLLAGAAPRPGAGRAPRRARAARCATRRWSSPTGCRSTTATPTWTAGRCSCPTATAAGRPRVIDQDGRPVAALVHDPALSDEPELLDAVSAAAGIALENAQLQAELRARLDELRGSRGADRRGRAEGAPAPRAQPPRRRPAAAGGALARARPAGGAPRRRPGRARAHRAGAARGRGVARRAARRRPRDPSGGRQRARAGGGARVARRARPGAGAPARSRSTARLPEALEVAAYYVVSESLANIGKHAQATSATVAVARTDGHVVVEVVDDGVGGADTERGTGLRGLADRVEALDGRLRISTRPGGGHTRTGGAAVRVVIAEDSVLLREGLARLLGDNGFDVVGRCATADDLLLKVRSYAPDVAIVDIRLPPTHNDEGMRAALEIRASHPAVGILVLSQYVELGLAMKLLADSAEGAGYLLKDRISRRPGVRSRRCGGSAGRLGAGPGHRLDAPVQATARRSAARADPARARGARADGRGAAPTRASPTSW